MRLDHAAPAAIAILFLVGCGGQQPAAPEAETAPATTGDVTPAPVVEAPPAPETATNTASCDGEVVRRGRQNLLELADGSVATFAPMQVNVDGAPRAYHEDGFAGGAIIHLCNAGEVHLPDGTRYHGSESNATCTGRFMADVAAIGAAGWDDPAVGAVRWYGIVGTGTATVAGRTVEGVRPVLQPNGSGFYVSPTTLSDPAFPATDQRAYVDALTVPHGVVRASSGVTLGSMGVAWRVRNCRAGRTCAPAPFLVADHGPRIGEGSLRLTRMANGLDPEVPITKDNRFQGSVDGPDVLWVFFNGEKLTPPYDPARVAASAREAFARWGGTGRLERCAAAAPEANG